MRTLIPWMVLSLQGYANALGGEKKVVGPLLEARGDVGKVLEPAVRGSEAALMPVRACGSQVSVIRCGVADVVRPCVPVAELICLGLQSSRGARPNLRA